MSKSNSTGILYSVLNTGCIPIYTWDFIVCAAALISFALLLQSSHAVFGNIFITVHLTLYARGLMIDHHCLVDTC